MSNSRSAGNRLRSASTVDAGIGAPPKIAARRVGSRSAEKSFSRSSSEKIEGTTSITVTLWVVTTSMSAAEPKCGIVTADPPASRNGLSWDT